MRIVRSLRGDGRGDEEGGDQVFNNTVRLSI